MQNDLKARTKAFALEIVQLYASLPKTAELLVIGKQLLRSGTSVGANYREAFRARSRQEFVAKLGNSLQELEETSYWLELLIESKLCEDSYIKSLQNEADELTAIFVSSIKKSKMAKKS